MKLQSPLKPSFLPAFGRQEPPRGSKEFGQERGEAALRCLKREWAFGHGEGGLYRHMGGLG